MCSAINKVKEVTAFIEIRSSFIGFPLPFAWLNESVLTPPSNCPNLHPLIPQETISIIMKKSRPFSVIVKGADSPGWPLLGVIIAPFITLLIFVWYLLTGRHNNNSMHSTLQDHELLKTRKLGSQNNIKFLHP